MTTMFEAIMAVTCQSSIIHAILDFETSFLYSNFNATAFRILMFT